jgi:nitric oxide reductase NorQ protein
VKIEKEPFYLKIEQEEDVFFHSYKNQLPLLLKGPTGTGKSRFIEYMAYTLDKNLLTVTCHEETSSTDLIGRYIIRGAETIWIDGPLTIAAKEGAILYLDEIAEARPDILVAIHSLTDYRRTLYLDKLGKEIMAHPEFMLVASYNPGYQKGFKELKPSTRQRFVSLSFKYPKPKVEQEIIQKETGVENGISGKLVTIGNRIRNLTELGLSETASTRLLVDAAKLIKSGLPPRLSVKVGILEPLTDDEESLQALEDIANLAI